MFFPLWKMPRQISGDFRKPRFYLGSQFARGRGCSQVLRGRHTSDNSGASSQSRPQGGPTCLRQRPRCYVLRRYAPASENPLWRARQHHYRYRGGLLSVFEVARGPRRTGVVFLLGCDRRHGKRIASYFMVEGIGRPQGSSSKICKHSNRLLFQHDFVRTTLVHTVWCNLERSQIYKTLRIPRQVCKAFSQASS